MTDSLTDTINFQSQRIQELMLGSDCFDSKSIAIHCENQLTLSALQACFATKPYEEERIKSDLREILRNRWERIAHTCNDYSENPFNPVNELCLDLAKLIEPLPADLDNLKKGEGPYFILMPTLQKEFYGENIHRYTPAEFIISDDKLRIMPVDGCLEYAYTSDDGTAKHTMIFQGDSGEMTVNELWRLTNHSLLIQEYVSLINRYNLARSADLLLPRLIELAQDLRRGGVAARGRVGGGEEYDSGAIANAAIVKFAQYWQSVNANRRQGILNQYPILQDCIGRLLRPTSANYQESRYCVQLVAADLEHLMDKMKQQNHTEFRNRVLAKQQEVQLALLSKTYQKISSPNLPQLSSKQVLANIEPSILLLHALCNQPDYLENLRATSLSMQDLVVNYRFKNGDSPFITAAKEGHLASVQLIISWNHPNFHYEIESSQALVYAAENGHTEIVHYLLSHGSIDPGGIKKAWFAALLSEQWKTAEYIYDWDEATHAKSSWDSVLSCSPYENLPKRADLQSPIMAASAAGQVRLVKALLQKQAYQVLDRDHKDNTTLGLAAQNGRAAVVECLLQQDAFKRTLNALDANNHTALASAIIEGHCEVVDLLVAAGADLFTEISNLPSILVLAHRYQRQEMMPTLLSAAFKQPIYIQAELLLTRGRGFYPTALHYALLNAPNSINTLMKQLATNPYKKGILSAKDSLGCSPLMLAVKQGHVAAVETLLFASPSYFGPGNERVREELDYQGNSLLSWAANNGHLEILILLLEKGAFVNSIGFEANTPLHFALMHNFEAVVDVLLQQPDLNREMRNGAGMTPFLTAAGHSSAHVLAKLYREPSNLQERDSKGNTALLCAAAMGNLSSVEWLLQQQVDIEQTNNEGMRAIERAICNNHPQVFLCLLRNKAKQSGVLPSLFKTENKACLQAFLTEVVTLPVAEQQQLLMDNAGLGLNYQSRDNFLLFASEKCPEFLLIMLEKLQKSASPEVCASLAEARFYDRAFYKKNHGGEEEPQGPTLLMQAAQRGDQACVELLLALGASLHAFSYPDKRTALHWAIESKQWSVAHYLLQQGASPHTQDIKGNTPLMLAFMHQGPTPFVIDEKAQAQQVFIQKLLQMGADITIKNKYKKNVFAIAAHNHCDAFMLYPLMQKGLRLSPLEQRELLSFDASDNLWTYTGIKNKEAFLESLAQELRISNERVRLQLDFLNKHCELDKYLQDFYANLERLQELAQWNSNYTQAAITASAHLDALIAAQKAFVTAVKTQKEDTPAYLNQKFQIFKKQCLEATEKARPELCKHRDYLGLVTKFIVMLVTCVISIPLILLGVFSNPLKTESQTKLDDFMESLPSELPRDAVALQ